MIISKHYIKATICMLVLGVNINVYAQEKIPVEINGDRVEYLSQEKKMQAFGNVVVIYEEIKLTCDNILLDVTSNVVFAEGNVKLYQGDTILTGDRLTYNLSTKQGEASNVDIESDTIYGKGVGMEKLSDREMQIKRGYFTTCDITPPHYRIWARKFMLYPGERIVAKNAFFYIGEIPVFYLPQYVHYLHDDRPRVTVMPGKDKTWGLYVLSAWRYYLNEGAKGRIHFDWREKRDIASGFDLFYKPQDFGESWQDIVLGTGSLKMYYMHERKLQRKHLWGIREYKLWGPIEEAYDPTLEKERFRLQWRHEWETEENIERDYTDSIVWEYNRLKDQEFMKDYFYRDEYEKNSTADTYALFTRSKPNYTLSLLERKRVDRNLDVIERQPEISFNLRNLPIFGEQKFYSEEAAEGDDISQNIDYNNIAEEDLYTTAESYYDKKQGSDVEFKERIFDPYLESSATFSNLNSKHAHSEIDEDVERLDTYNKLSIPKKFFYINLNPYTAIRETFYSKDINGDPITPRAAFSYGIDTSTKFFRIFDFDTNFLNININGLRHIVTPSINYGFANDPTIPSAKLLQFDSIDSISRSEAVTLSLENKLQTKRKKEIVDFMRFIMNTSYDLNDSSGSKFSAINYDLEIVPYPNSRFELDASYDTQNYLFSNLNFDVTRHSGGSKYSDYDIFGDDWSYGAGYRYQRKGSKQLTTEGAYRLNPKWKVKAYERFELARGKFLREQEYTVYRDLHCWVLQFTYNVTREYGETFWIAFRLKAFPEMSLDFENSYHTPKAMSQSKTFAER